MAKQKRKSIPQKLKMFLQKEIDSRCPFCENQDVGYFEFHHIDEDPSNSILENLLLICPNCHSKITKGDISEEDVKKKKANLQTAKSNIEFASVLVDSEICCWQPYENRADAFHSTHNRELSKLITLQWSFINHTSQTVILKGLRYEAKSLPSGISGIPRASILSPIISYKIPIETGQGRKKIPFKRQIQIPEKQAFQFETELFQGGMGNKRNPTDGRLYIDFVFEFSGNQKVKVPRLFLNCQSEEEKMSIGYIG